MPLYTDLRPSIKTGDCILWEGHGAISRLIRVFSQFSHASLVVRLDKYSAFVNRVFLVEALANGLQLRLMSYKLEYNKGRAYLFQPAGVSEKQREKIQEMALIDCAKNIPYDYASLFRNALGRVNSNVRSYFCSEFVWDKWWQVSLVKGQVAPRPGDIPKWVQGRLTEIVRDT